MKKIICTLILAAISAYSLTCTSFAADKEADLSSKEAYGLYAFGVKDLESGNFEEAEAKFDEAIKLNPNNALLYNELGYVHYLQGRIKESIKEYTKAIELKPDYSTAYNNLAGAYDEIGKLDKAVDAYKKALELKPNYAIVHNNLGHTYIKLNNISAALEHLNKSIKIDPYFFSAYNNLGNAYIKQNNFDEAIKNLEKAKSINPEAAKTLNRLGYAYYKNGNTDQSLSNLKLAIEEVSDNKIKSEINYNLGLVYYNLKDYTNAIDKYQEAIKLKPDYAEAHRNLAFAYKDNNNSLKAIEQLKLYLKKFPNSPDKIAIKEEITSISKRK